MQILNIGLQIDLGEQNVRKCEGLALPVIICNVYSGNSNIQRFHCVTAGVRNSAHSVAL